MENEWQPVRIAPVEQWDDAHDIKAGIDFEAAGKIVRVRPIGICTSELGCTGPSYEVHPDDVPLLAERPIPPGRCLVCEHQIIAD